MKKIILKEISIERLVKSLKHRIVNLTQLVFWYLKINKNDITINKKSTTAVLLANGPSLANLDVSKINPEWDVFGMNRIYIDSKIYSRISGIFLVNRLVASQFRSDFENLNIPLVVPSNLLSIFKGVKGIDILRFNPLKGGFAKKITDSFNPASTVTYFALQVLYVMGYRKVILIGLDHNFGNQSSVNKTEKVTKDLHHFNENYFPKGTKWETPDLSGSEYWYDLAKREYKINEIELLDATEMGKCQIFDKINLNTLLNKNK